jgi:hypothetical protein
MSMTASRETEIGDVDLQRPLKLAVASPESERTMAVRVADWRRIRASVERLDSASADHAVTWAATALGAAIGLGGTVLSLVATRSTVRPGLIPSLVVAAGAMLLFGWCVARLTRRQVRQSQALAADVCADMDQVEHGILARDCH